MSVTLKFPVCKRSTDTESMTGLEERKSLIANPENETNDPSNECNGKCDISLYFMIL